MVVKRAAGCQEAGVDGRMGGEVLGSEGGGREWKTVGEMVEFGMMMF